MSILTTPVWAGSTVPLQVVGESFPTTTFALAAGMLVLGYLIRFHQMTGLIAGVNPDMVADEERLANLVGGTLFLMSLLTFAYGIVLTLDFAGGNLSTVYEVVIVGLLLVMLVKARTV